MLFEEDFECLVNYAALESLDIPLILFVEGGLQDEEVGKGVWEDVDLELYLIPRVAQLLWVLRLNHNQGDPLDDLRRLRHLSACFTVELDQV